MRGMRKITGSRPARVQGNKAKKNCARSLDNMEEKKRENGGRGRRESAKRQRAKGRNEIHFYSYSK